MNLIGPEELPYYLDKGNVIIIDIRDKESYEELHLTGAKNMCFNGVLENAKSMSKRKIYLIYCDKGNLSLKLALKLSNHGINAISLVGGFEALKEYYYNNY